MSPRGSWRTDSIKGGPHRVRVPGEIDGGSTAPVLGPRRVSLSLLLSLSLSLALSLCVGSLGSLLLGCRGAARSLSPPSLSLSRARARSLVFFSLSLSEAESLCLGAVAPPLKKPSSFFVAYPLRKPSSFFPPPLPPVHCVSFE